MTKTKKIIYWVSTIWLALGMASSGIVQLLRIEEEIKFILDLGYPVYFLTIIAVWKILGIIALFIPKFPILKEWTYAGFFFLSSGALLSHIASGSAAADIFGPVLLLVLTIVSWWSRPADRKIPQVTS